MQEVRDILPRYGAAEAIAKALIDLTKERNLAPGDPFLSDHQVMELTGKSRTAVRRALKLLQDGEWIERRNGIGTFVGPQIARYNQDMLGQVVGNLRKAEAARRLLHVLVADVSLEKHGRDLPSLPDSSWRFSEVTNGLASLALESNFLLELLDCSRLTAQQASARFEQKRPDLMLALGEATDHLPVLSEVMRRDIPFALALGRMPTLNCVQIYDDHLGAVAMAVRFLQERGFRRIGFVHTFDLDRGALDRYEGYRRAMSQAGTAIDESLVLILTPESLEPEETLVRYCTRPEQERPDSLICGSELAARWLGQIVRKGLVPLAGPSVVAFEQDAETVVSLAPVRAATMIPPLNEIGRTLARLVRPLANKESDIAPPPPVPYRLLPEDGTVWER
ncbi:MAG: substrate-binding domain-containing protein [Planctomycetia bacterium]|nr:substrate-binding domain-containing protein [Planctomycetia bacterium]